MRPSAIGCRTSPTLRPRASGLGPRRLIRGFTLIEIMIATVILGIGLVMVATVFPVAVSQTRDAVQKAIVQSVADSAIQTLRLRLRSVTGITQQDNDSSDLPGDRPHTSAAPPNGATDSTGATRPTRPSDYDIDPATCGLQTDPSPYPRGFRVIRTVNIARPPDPQNPQSEDQFLAGGPGNGVLVDSPPEAILVPSIPSQFAGAGNCWADENPRLRPFWSPIGGGTYPQIDLLERVYPPVEPSWAQAPMNNSASDGFPRFGDIAEAANRRYCWLALGAPGSGAPGPQGPPYQLRIFVMYRSDLTARYAAQEFATAYTFRHTVPRARDEEFDTLLPQPWLVRFDDGNPATRFHTNYTAEFILQTDPQVLTGARLPPGTIICTNAVANLLPEGSTFIDFELGRARTVLRNIADPSSPGYDPRNPSHLRLLYVAPDSELNAPTNPNNQCPNFPTLDGMKVHYPDFPDYAWVVPPPIVRPGGGRDDYYFEEKSPVLAVVSATLPRR